MLCEMSLEVLWQGGDMARRRSIPKTLEKLNNLVQDKLVDNMIVEGHFAHLMDNMDHIIVLRCDPRELRKRMEKRNYSEIKIKENLEAEALGLIYSEACANIKNNESYLILN